MFLRTRKSMAVIPLLLAIVVLCFISCEKAANNEPDPVGSSKLEIYLTDSPADYKAVWIDLQQIMIKISNDSAHNSGWVEVPLVNPGKYNLLEFRNGKNTLLAASDIPPGKISQIRLVLGKYNSITLDNGDIVNLKIPGDPGSGFSINVSATLAAGVPYALVLDFDAARSIIKAGKSNQYLLSPMIRTFEKDGGGTIEGIVLPDSAKAYVMAAMPDDTVTAFPDPTGYYKFWGLTPGTYQLTFITDSHRAYHDDTLDSIQVRKGKVTTLDSLWLQKQVSDLTLTLGHPGTE